MLNEHDHLKRSWYNTMAKIKQQMLYPKNQAADAAEWLSAHLKAGKEIAQDLLGAAEGRISLLLSDACSYLCAPGKPRWPRGWSRQSGQRKALGV